MNIIFLLKGLEIGGVEIVSATLANKFVLEGHNVSFFVFDPTKNAIKQSLNKTIKVYEGTGLHYCSANTELLRRSLKKEKIDVIINQWGLHWLTIRTAKKANKEFGCKIITVYHNDPATNGRLQSLDIKISQATSLIQRRFYSLQRMAVRVVTGASMRYVYENSDKYLLLSPSFKKTFLQFIWKKRGTKVDVIPNPLTIETEKNNPCSNQKRNQLLMVGRIDFNQKRTLRAIEVWKCLEPQHPDWDFVIVGDGPDMNALKNYVEQSNLKNVHLEGFKKPNSYYKDASLLILTSEYEGFGLVIVEGMAYGVVPIVLNSYLSAKDLVQNEENGFLIPYDKKIGFNPISMAQRVELLINNEEKRSEMSKKAFESSFRFSIDSIYKQWDEILKN